MLTEPRRGCFKAEIRGGPPKKLLNAPPQGRKITSPDEATETWMRAMYDATGVGRDFKAGLEESGIVPVVVDLSACTQVTNFRGQKAALYYDPSRGMEDNDPSGGQGRSYKDPSLGQTWREEWRAGAAQHAR